VDAVLKSKTEERPAAAARYPAYEGEHTFHFAGLNDRFFLESGASLPAVTVNFQTYGRLNAAGDNALYIAHALTGGSLVGDHRLPGKEGGWWEPLVGPGKAFDTNRYFVICSNVLGGCYGTTGPASLDTRQDRPYAMRFPVVTVRDMVRVQKRLLDHLGVKKLACVAGGSLGGMQVLEWGVCYPQMVERLIAIAVSGRLSPIGIAFNQAGRRAVINDPLWRQGEYYGGDLPRAGLSLARLIATITYRSYESFESRFGRTLQKAGDENQLSLRDQFVVESYLEYQGEKLTHRFDPNAYLYLSKAMDLHDLGRGFTSFRAALERIKGKVFLMGISSDILFYPQEVRGLAVEMRRCGVDARYEELTSPHGHDSFLIEFHTMDGFIRDCLNHK
jgi:homoserine O-acetyltransferase/O-succinyltransferase